MSRFPQCKIRSLKLQIRLPPTAIHLEKQMCLFMQRFPRNYRHTTLCRYQLTDQRCHGLIMREINDTVVVQIIAVNNAH